MPIQSPQWTDFLSCPVCCRDFGSPSRLPVSLGCGHTICKHCLNHLHRKQCPFDQTTIKSGITNLVVNTALLQLVGVAAPEQPYHPPNIKALSEEDRRYYDLSTQCIEQLALHLKYSGNGGIGASRLSRPMQRKLVTLVQCALAEEEGRGRAYRAARSLGERTVTELILQHQNPQQLSANLWAAVRARGCQFLGPAMQEEVLKLVLLALEDGSALSRKILVMFVVQHLEKDFSQASKTSIGHVVQLLYRASCFKVSKRESDSSLMQLKEEFRSYDSLRREHDAQIVQISTEAGLRIAPDQWSALLYGDTAHKSHMQSIIDKLQTPQSFVQSVQELVIALQRTGDPARLSVLGPHLEKLAAIDPSPDLVAPSWQELYGALDAVSKVVVGLVHFVWKHGNASRDNNHNHSHQSTQRSNNKSQQQQQQQQQSTVSAVEQRSSTASHQQQSKNQPSTTATVAEQSQPTTSHKYKMCREGALRGACPRTDSYPFTHDDELEKYRYNRRKKFNNSCQMFHSNLSMPNDNQYLMSMTNGNSKLNNVHPIQNNQINYSANEHESACSFPATNEYYREYYQTFMNNSLVPTDTRLCNFSNQNTQQNSALVDQTFSQDFSQLSLGIDNNRYLPRGVEHFNEPASVQSQEPKHPTDNTTFRYWLHRRPEGEFLGTGSMTALSSLMNVPPPISSVSNPRQDLFIRSDSILTDDDFVPYEAPPLSKYGPIKRFIGPTSTVNRINAVGCYNTNHTPGVSQSEEDTYEEDIAKDIRELELKWDFELQEVEKRWSSEDETHK